MKKLIIAVCVCTLLCFTGTGFAMGYGTNAEADAEASAGAALMQGDINSGNVTIAAPIPGSVGFGPLINYFGKPLPSSGFQPVEQLLMYGCWFTEGSLQSILKKVEDAEAEFKIVNADLKDAPVAVEDGKTKWIKVVISRDKYTGADVNFVGFSTARSEHPKTTMAEVMAKAALTALENGCNVIHFTAQGAVRDVESFGWGVGFNTTQAQIYSSGDKSNVSSGGFGISKGTAGMRDKPWLQGFGLIDYDVEYPVLRIAETAPAQVILNNVKPATASVETPAPVELIAETPTPVENKIILENAIAPKEVTFW